MRSLRIESPNVNPLVTGRQQWVALKIVWKNLIIQKTLWSMTFRFFFVLVSGTLTADPSSLVLIMSQHKIIQILCDKHAVRGEFRY